MIIKRSLLLITMALVVSTLAYGADVNLNGYTFSDDSADINLNRFFYTYSNGIDSTSVLYGYGYLSGYDFNMTFRQYFTIYGIDCCTYSEEYFVITPSPNDDTLTVLPHNVYLYYAKDTEDNIHILNDISGSIGGTTLLYPNNPYEGQRVCYGYVEDIDVQVGDYEKCVIIHREYLPYTGIGPIKEYLIPNGGILAISYNMYDDINGFSKDGVAPENAEETEDSTLKKWWDDHFGGCFISACAN